LDHLPINVYKVSAIGIPDERLGEIAAASVWSKDRTDPDPHQGTVKTVSFYLVPAKKE
jgi:hypothetical protein